MHLFKDELLVGQGNHRIDLRVVKQHVAQAGGTQILVDAVGNDDAAVPAVAQQRKAALGEQLVEVDVGAGAFATHYCRLVLVVSRAAEVGTHVREAALVSQPARADVFVLQQAGLLDLEFLDGHVLLADLL